MVAAAAVLVVVEEEVVVVMERECFSRDDGCGCAREGVCADENGSEAEADDADSGDGGNDNVEMPDDWDRRANDTLERRGRQLLCRSVNWTPCRGVGVCA